MDYNSGCVGSFFFLDGATFNCIVRSYNLEMRIVSGRDGRCEGRSALIRPSWVDFVDFGCNSVALKE